MRNVLRWLAPAGVLAALLLIAAPASAGAGPAPKRVPFQRAVTLAEWGPTAYEPARVERVLRRLKKRQHIDSVTLTVVWLQRDEEAVEVRPGHSTVPEARVRAAIRTARKLRLHVVLRPYVDREDGGWRGQIQPSSLDAWFASYGSFIRRYATIARREGAHGLVVGSEMTTVSDEADRWRALVAGVRKRFRGWIAYQANWGGEEIAIKWWDAVDAISVSAYYPVAAAPGLSVGQLVDNWRLLIDRFGQRRRWFERLEAISGRERRPVLFGEIGYRPVPGAAVEPWNTELGGSDRPAQAKAYQAAFQVWYQVPWFRGMHWWYVTPDDPALDGQPGADHRPGPEALRTLARWYRRPPR